MVRDRTKILGHTGGSFFFTPIGLRPYRNFGTYRRVFLFPPELVRDRTKILGHTGGSFFFTRIWSQTVPKFRTYRRIFLFHQNLVADLIATVIGEDLVVWTLLSSFPRSVGQLLKLPPYCSGPGGFSRSCPPSILRWDGLQGFGQFLYPPKGGIFSERADAFVISSNRQT